MANRLTDPPVHPLGQAGVNTTAAAETPAKRTTKDRTKDRHRPGYWAQYMRLYRAAHRRTKQAQGAG